jgi:lysozyme
MIQKPINTDALDKLKYMLEKQEGYRQYVYMDSVGVPTVGIGRNLRDKGLSHDEAQYLLANDIRDCQNELWQFVPVYRELDDVRKVVLIDMAFNLGIEGLLGFRGMLKALADKDYKLVSQHMLDSKWATQVGTRAHDLAWIMEQGVL